MSSYKVTSNEPASDADEAEAKLVRKALKDWRNIADAQTEMRRDALDDLNFATGEKQWPDDIKRQRDEDKRPCLTINQLPQFVRQVTNDLRQNRPSITVSPVDDDADLDTAEVIQGMMRHIEYNSNADVAYDTATGCAVRSSFGYFRVVVEYADAMSFEQELKIKRIRNPMTVYYDTTCQEPDGSDGKRCFIVEDIPVEDYRAEWPDSKLASAMEVEGIGDSPPEWISGESVRIAEWFEVVREHVKIVMLNNGQVLKDSQIEKDKDGNDKLPKGVFRVGDRMTWVKTVKQRKINAMEILEETEWLGTWIPVIPVIGDEIDVDGKVILESVVRHAKDPQRMFNYWASAETEMIALAPKAPFIGVEGQFEDYEEQWNKANVKSMAYLEYKPVTVGDKPAPAPTRNVVEPATQAITMARQASKDDLKATIGIYDPNLGAMGNETSGRAILARQNQGHTSTFHFSDNFARAQKHLGRILLELIPKYYDTARTTRIVSESGIHKQVKINQSFTDDKGIQKMYDLTVGRYDVVISSGPSYNTKRQETAASMQEVISAYPQLMAIAGDILVSSFDWPGAKELAARIRATLPPAIQNLEKDPTPPAVQEQMKQMQQMIQQLTQELAKATQKVETKTETIQSNERIALFKTKADMIKAMMQINSSEAMHQFQVEMDHVNALLAQDGDNDPADAAKSTTQTLTS